jgi:predicted phosphoribosyltransferase
MNSTSNVIEIQPLHDRERVFADRAHAGRTLAGMLAVYRGSNAIVFAIPAGGLPVAAVIARELMLPLDVAVVSKITLPWNTEAGFGAVAFDGGVRLNQLLIDKLSLSEEDIREGIDRTRHKVMKRLRRFRDDRPFPDNARSPAILVDDGLASGYTMLAAIEALRKSGVQHIVVAVPTGQIDTVRHIAGQVDALYCPNVRERRQFAVADAYLSWSDVEEDTALRLMQREREREQTQATATVT